MQSALGDDESAQGIIKANDSFHNLDCGVKRYQEGSQISSHTWLPRNRLSLEILALIVTCLSRLEGSTVPDGAFDT